MKEMKGGRRTQLLEDLRNRRRYWKLKIQEDGNDSLSHEHKEEIKVIFYKSLDLLTSGKNSHVFIGVLELL